jgi:acyl-[acyl-carrier-protein]-phospholipid O-acyltransferase/long-chain-fatty-acid--[acyl-carrier-protein] ligase
MINSRTFPVDVNSPYAVKRMAEYLQKGGRLVLFPEGRLSRTGSLMKLFDGTGFLLFKTKARVITAYIRGGQYLPLSPNRNHKKWFPRVSVHFSELLTAPRWDPCSATEARARLTEWLRDRMVEQQFRTEMEFGLGTLPAAICRTAAGRMGFTILQDVTLQKVSYRRLMIGASLMGQQWDRPGGLGAGRVGVLLPNVNATPMVLLSLWLCGRVPAVLNYTTGSGIMLSCCRLAGLKQVITSKAFIERSKLDLQALTSNGVSIVWLEDVRNAIGTGDKWRALAKSFFGSPVTGLQSWKVNQLRPEDSAVVLFTSGSEGDPKGVELTHSNVLSNIRQMLSVIDLHEGDRFFNALPLFHSFGLSVGLLLPLVRGEFVQLYVSPLHYRIVPSAFYNLDCTVLFGTNTFLAGYGRKAHPYDFRSLRYVFAGAEKLQEATSRLWANKFGVRILEGYGATECSPCLTVNLPMRPRSGSAGQFLPAIDYKLETVEGVTDEPASGSANAHGDGAAGSKVGRLLVRGPNIMRGYLNEQANARFQALGGWYDTGDLVRIDREGYLFVLGRLKRFAKISGEMVSLTAIEDTLANAFPQYGLRFAAAIITKPDETKGEKLIAATNEPRLTLEEVRSAIRARGLGNLYVPRELRVVPELPRLGTGKINHRELEKMI